MTEQAAQEPTMEEILASIRRIISEDDAPAETAPVAEAAPEPAPEPEPVVAEPEPAPVVMRKFSGFITDAETTRGLRAEVGNDAARFFYVLRKSDQHLDFDLDLAKSESNDNPVYYIQYAHARICSVLREAVANHALDLSLLPGIPFDALTGERELLLAQRLAEFPDVITQAVADRAPHSVAFYLRDVASDFHAFYNASRMLVDDLAVREARLALAAATRQVIANGLSLLGVSAPESM